MDLLRSTGHSVYQQMIRQRLPWRRGRKSHPLLRKGKPISESRAQTPTRNLFAVGLAVGMRSGECRGPSRDTDVQNIALKRLAAVRCVLGPSPHPIDKTATYAPTTSRTPEVHCWGPHGAPKVATSTLLSSSPGTPDPGGRHARSRDLRADKASATNERRAPARAVNTRTRMVSAAGGLS
jgi:hypothetical protein